MKADILNLKIGDCFAFWHGQALWFGSAIIKKVTKGMPIPMQNFYAPLSSSVVFIANSDFEGRHQPRRNEKITKYISSYTKNTLSTQKTHHAEFDNVTDFINGVYIDSRNALILDCEMKKIDTKEVQKMQVLLALKNHIIDGQELKEGYFYEIKPIQNKQTTGEYDHIAICTNVFEDILDKNGKKVGSIFALAESRFTGGLKRSKCVYHEADHDIELNGQKLKPYKFYRLKASFTGFGKPKYHADCSTKLTFLSHRTENLNFVDVKDKIDMCLLENAQLKYGFWQVFLALALRTKFDKVFKGFYKFLENARKQAPQDCSEFAMTLLTYAGVMSKHEYSRHGFIDPAKFVEFYGDVFDVKVLYRKK